MTPDIITGNGRPAETKLPCTLEELLVAKSNCRAVWSITTIILNRGDYLCISRPCVVRWE